MPKLTSKGDTNLSTPYYNPYRKTIMDKFPTSTVAYKERKYLGGGDTPYVSKGVDTNKSTMSEEAALRLWREAAEAWEREVSDSLFGDTPVKSDGWATSYYDVPASVKDVDDLIVHFKLNWHMANILKACLRYGKKEGVTKEYDLNKIDFMSKRERENIKDE